MPSVPEANAPAAATSAATEPPKEADLATLFDGAPEGYALARMVPLHRTVPKKLAVWCPPGWNTFDQERYDDLLNVEAPGSKATVFVNTSIHTVSDARRKLWTESLTVRQITYGDWVPGFIGKAHFPARVSEGAGTLDNR
jgi:hypothetical protein